MSKARKNALKPVEAPNICVQSLDQSAQSSDGAVIRCVRGANIEEKVRIPSGMEVDDELLTFLHRSKLVCE